MPATTTKDNQALLATPSGIRYRLRRSLRAKKTRIVVKSDQIEVVAPPHVAESSIRAFVQAQQDWIAQAQKRVHSRAAQINSLAPSHYRDGARIPYRGQQLPLTIVPASGKTLRLQLREAQMFIVQLPIQLAAEDCSELIKLSLQRWMQQQARDEALKLIERHAARCQLQPRSLRIKTQKSRWGSCGPNNDINLNWLLMLTPPPVMEYVVIHELCHIRHKNHSPAFWGLVAEHMPDYQQQRQWLKQHGASVMRGL